MRGRGLSLSADLLTLPESQEWDFCSRALKFCTQPPISCSIIFGLLDQSWPLHCGTHMLSKRVGGYQKIILIFSVPSSLRICPCYRLQCSVRSHASFIWTRLGSRSILGAAPWSAMLVWGGCFCYPSLLRSLIHYTVGTPVYSEKEVEVGDFRPVDTLRFLGCLRCIHTLLVHPLWERLPGPQL